MINYYHILGISQNASQKEIKEAYRKLARQYHPDKNPGSAYAEERFKELSHAYHILRDPVRKSKHDHTLAYEAFKKISGNAPAYQPQSPAPPYAYQQRKGPRGWQGHTKRPAPPIGSRQNIIATAWAFGIFFLFALIVFGLTSYQSYQKEQTLEKQNELALGILKRAEQYYGEKNYEYALQLLRTIDDSHFYSSAARELQDSIFNLLRSNGDRNFETHNFEMAAGNYQLLTTYQKEYDPLLFARLVSSYEQIPDYPKAIETYKRVIGIEPATIEARIRLAALLYKQGNFEKALDYYLEASKIVTAEYEQTYGKAFALAVNPARTPLSHYQLHCGLGATYAKLGMHRQAGIAYKWAIFLRPEEPEAHYLMGNNFLEEDNLGDACKKWKEAREHGSAAAIQQLKKHCK